MTTTSTDRQVFLHDIFVTALEGGIGYWSEAYEYHWSNDVDGRTVEDLDGFYATIVNTEDGDGGQVRIDASVIRRGLSRITKATGPYYDPNGTRTQNADVPFLTKYSAATIRQASFDNDAGDIDSDLADQIVQAGLFGEIRYG